MNSKHFQIPLSPDDHAEIATWAAVSRVKIATITRALLIKAAADPDGVGKQLIRLARD